MNLNKDKELNKDKKEIFLNNPNNLEEDKWKKNLEKLGINQIKMKDVKKDDISQNNYDDEFNQVFEISEKLTFKEEKERERLEKEK